ncbi:protein-tyrosine phosphatase [Sediminihabitans luteus]|uniref:Protein-tyrosine phosphatase n=1 Tax=Sediminihabitans luteus TaxID=1138585 RepID=A0A2M9D156_9CELL|nr:tyrosine-protein phosphatase [Sediminihabitans luteus]PJJ77944.1 protein-tyrosine phosphatase [Sediminihabitans luteus]GII99698.1 putative phosphotyrosine protein phosphatase [Sediminihabitans luteus]
MTGTFLLDGLANLRDVGGIPAGDRTIRPGVLYRADSLAALTPAGRAQLAASSIGAVVDMRSSTEVLASPGWAPDAPHPRLHPMPMLEGAVQQLATMPTLEGVYRDLLQGAGEQFVQVARLVVETAPEGVLVHCTAGKDRTGVATALLLLAVGADREAVLADYALSSDNLDGPWMERTSAAVRAAGAELTPALVELLGGTDPVGLDRVLAEVEEQHGSVLGYLRAHGLTDAEAEGLQERLLA